MQENYSSKTIADFTQHEAAKQNATLKHDGINYQSNLAAALNVFVINYYDVRL